MNTRNWQIILAVGDIVILILFTIIGQADHQTNDPSNPVGSLLLAGGPFIVAWLGAAFLLGAYRADVFTPRVMFTRSLTAWLIAAPIGIILRSFAMGRVVVPLNFILAAYGFGGLFVLGWRIIFAFIVQWRQRARAAK
ncbi:MAG: hypothetical protein HDKAJFGB_01298 [Anaerolineae bacterium]|nr:hypothetical protein [Anaerolineae bacterium]